MSAPVAAIVGAGVGAVIAGIFNTMQLRVATREREQTRREQNLIGAFQYFDGGAQRRSIGISIIEAFQQETPELIPEFIPLLANQAVYLLTQSGVGDRQDELNNLDRIIALLGQARSAARFTDRYDDLEKVLDRNQQGDYQNGLRPDTDRIARYRTYLEAEIKRTDSG